jgi:ankyrin repeat protein
MFYTFFLLLFIPIHLFPAVEKIEKKILQTIIAQDTAALKKILVGLSYKTREDMPNLLAYAALHGTKDAVCSLLEHLAHPDTRGMYGFTPLQEAVERRKKPLVELLLHKKASLKVPILRYNAEGDLEDSTESILMLAATHGFENQDVIIELINQKAELEARNKDGNTALFLACKHGHIDNVATLLLHNASLKSINNKHETLLEFIAEEPGAKAIQELLDAHNFLKTN